MKWQFWLKSARSPSQIQLAQIQQQLSEMSEQSAEQVQQLAFMADKLNASSEQIIK